MSADLLEAFSKWVLEFERAPRLDDGFDLDLDWADFHRRGLALTKRLKAEIGNSARVRYVAPCEDPNHILIRDLEILSDGSVMPIP